MTVAAVATYYIPAKNRTTPVWPVEKTAGSLQIRSETPDLMRTDCRVVYSYRFCEKAKTSQLSPQFEDAEDPEDRPLSLLLLAPGFIFHTGVPSFFAMIFGLVLFHRNARCVSLAMRKHASLDSYHISGWVSCTFA